MAYCFSPLRESALCREVCGLKAQRTAMEAHCSHFIDAEAKDQKRWHIPLLGLLDIPLLGLPQGLSPAIPGLCWTVPSTIVCMAGV